MFWWFLRGMGSCLGIYPEIPELDLKSNEEAIREDWENVGKDMRRIYTDPKRVKAAQDYIREHAGNTP